MNALFVGPTGGVEGEGERTRGDRDAVAAQAEAQHRLVVHHELVAGLIRQVAPQLACVHVPHLHSSPTVNAARPVRVEVAWIAVLMEEQSGSRVGYGVAIALVVAAMPVGLAWWRQPPCHVSIYLSIRFHSCPHPVSGWYKRVPGALLQQPDIQ